MVGRLVLILPVHTWSRNIVNVGHPIDNCLLKSCCLKEMYLERKKSEGRRNAFGPERTFSPARISLYNKN